MPDPITLVATSFEDTLAIPLDVVRNQSWNPVFTITDQDGAVIDLNGYSLSLVVVPVNYDGSIGAPIWTCATFTVLPNGSAQFAVPATNTAAIVVTGFYQWFLESIAPGDTATSVVVAGSLNVFDSPVPNPGTGKNAS